MVQCSRCGTIYEESAAYCPHCGANAPVYSSHRAAAGAGLSRAAGQNVPPQPPVYAPPVNPYGRPQQNPYYMQPPIVPPPYNGMSVGGFVLSCVSLVLCCFPITALVGLVLSIISLPQIDRRGERGKGLAIAGIILNSLVVLFWIVMFIFAMIDGAMYGLY